MKRFFLFGLLLFSYSLFAQKNSPYICNFSVPDSIQQEVWSIAQSKSGFMFFAGSRGVIQTDGKLWNRLVLPFMPTALSSDEQSDIVWVGGKNAIGYLERNKYGSFSTAVVFSEKSEYFSVENTICAGNKVFFVASNKIFIVDATTKKLLTTIKTDAQVTAAFAVGKKLAVYLESKGLFMVDETKLSSSLFSLENDAIVVGCEWSGKVILGTASNKILLFNGSKTEPFLSGLDSFLSENVLHDFAVDAQGDLVISTLIGGIAVVDTRSGSIRQLLNYNNGLPDNEIYALKIDQMNGVWVAHEKGLSRVDFTIPVHRYDIIEGLNGSILDVAKYNGTLYVATSDGVYYLTQTEIVREIEVAKPVEEVRFETVKKEVEQTSRSFLMFHKREKVEQTETRKVSKTVIQKTKVTKRVPGAWVYKKVEGVGGKCKQLVATGYGLLVAGNNGVFEIRGTQASAIISGKYISEIESSQFHAHYYCLTDEGVYLLKSDNGIWSYSQVFSKISQKISSLAEVDDNTVWLTANNEAFRVTTEKDTVMQKFVVGTRFYPHVIVRSLGKATIFVADNDMFEWNGSAIVPYSKGGRVESCITSGLAVWLKQHGQWTGYEGTKQDSCNWIGLFGSIRTLFTDADGLLWVIDGQKGLFCITDKKPAKLKTLSLQIVSQKSDDSTLYALGAIELPTRKHGLQLDFALPSFLQSGVEYQYYIDGLSSEWSRWQSSGTLHLNFLPHGSYTIHLRARDGVGNVTNEITVDYTVPTPFTQSIWFYLIVFVAVIIVSFLVFKWRMRALQREKDILEEKVRERTKTIEEQKEEIASQLEEILQNKEEIEAQRDEIEAQRDTIVEQNDEIVKSITYAQRIQHAVMPTGDWLKNMFADYFVLYQPRDIVSGDFYWMVQMGKKVIVAAADCTGHGVPGAFMSMLGVSFMNEIVLKNQLTHSDEIANQLRKTVIDTLSHNNQESKDGMDMALCVFDFETNTVQFTGAYNPLILIRNGEITEFAANRMPIGRYEKTDSFTAETIQFKKGDQFYLFSDGFEDQFGGEAEKKLKKVRFKEWLLQQSTVSLSKQKSTLQSQFEQWKGDLPQTDDVLVVGLKI